VRLGAATAQLDRALFTQFAVVATNRSALGSDELESDAMRRDK